MTYLREGGRVSVSMINNTLREWIFVWLSLKIITGGVGFNKRQYAIEEMHTSSRVLSVNEISTKHLQLIKKK